MFCLSVGFLAAIPAKKKNIVFNSSNVAFVVRFGICFFFFFYFRARYIYVHIRQPTDIMMVFSPSI